MTTEIDRFPHGLLDFHNFMVEQWLLFCGGRLFRQRIANFATDKKDGVVCATRRGVQYFVGTTWNGAVHAQKASGNWTSFKVTIKQWVV